MTGYNPLLAELNKWRLPWLRVVYREAYPATPPEEVSLMTRDTLLGCLLRYAETGLVARQWLAMQAKGER